MIATPKPSPVFGRTFSKPEELYAALKDHIANLASEAINARGQFNVVVTGGQTVIPLYRNLRGLSTPWHAWRVFWSDERCLPVEHLERNSRQAYNAWLAHVPVSDQQIFPIPAELGPDAGAAHYSRQLEAEGTFDLVLLSLGEDGHVASIFSVANSKDEFEPTTLPVRDAPKLPPQRVSLSLSRLANARSVILLVVGANKRAALAEFATDPQRPITQLRHLVNLDVWADQ